jgi:acetylornithine deacetylase/succinyl-diaminopimelate desuccinylase-like protein
MKPLDYLTRIFVAGALFVACQASALAATAAEPIRPDQATFRELYRELVETNTTLSTGSCTEAAEKMAARLRSAGFAGEDLHLIVVPDHPREGNLVAVLKGSDTTLPAMLLLAHIDVVEAKREDWTRDPFTLIEEGGYFYARGSFDDKAMAAVWVDSLMRFKREGFKPRRTIKMALTCGEETNGAFNGARYLSTEKLDLIDAGFALNEGAWAALDAEGKRVQISVQAGEKASQNYRLEVTNPGGHSSRPVKDNAIYHLAAGLTRVSEYAFPIHLNDTTRTYFTRMAALKGGALGEAMRALVKNPDDAAAVAAVTADPTWNAMLRTTCVATMLSGGHATNALPQRATANINCRVHPADSLEGVRDTLANLVADPAVTVTMLEVRGPPAKAPDLTAAMLKPIEKIGAKLYPGVPLIPIFQAGGTDGQFTGAAGIPTYGIGVMFVDPNLGNIHGLNERIPVQSVYDGRDFLHELVKTYANTRTPLP